MAAPLRALVATFLLTLAATAASAAPLTLSARAGLGGMVRPGRWVPITVSVVNDETDVAGELVIEWGDARLHHAVELPAPSRHTWSFLVRTADVRDRVSVRLESAGDRLAETTAPVRIAGDDETVTVCTEGIVPAAGLCTVLLPAADLPVSYRGFDAADAVMTRDELLTPAVRSALALWRDLRALDTIGNNAPAAGMLAASPAPATRARLPLAAYLTLLGVAFAVGRARRFRPALYVALVAAIVLGSALALASGRTQPIVVNHATVVQAFTGLDTVVVHSRLAAAFPSETDAALVIDAPDASVTSLLATPGEEWQDDAGRAIVAHGATLGSTADVRLDAAVNARLLHYSAEGPGAVRNISDDTLRDCRFPDAFAQREVAALAPGAAVAQARRLVETDPVVVCHTSDLPLTFSHPTSAVTVRGDSTVVLHLPGATP